ncbi:penicillin-binding protein 2 [Candidatus Kaiserbacteria bacterium]|nr:penicillin-binding protein 2 [Candidatus Kaiserbacteria bacterium]
MKSRFVWRTRILAGCFVLVALLFIVRLYFLQIVHGSYYESRASSHYVKRDSDTVNRSTIYFTAKNGELVSAAVMQTGWLITIKPDEILDAAAVYEQLNALTPIDKERFFARANKKGDPYEEVASRLPDDIAKKIRALKIPGILLVQDQWRFYPAGVLAAQAIGFVGYQGNTRVGVYGLEKSWQDTLLQTQDGFSVNPFAEIFTNIRAAVSTNPAAHEGSVVTSIEPSVQRELEDTLDGIMKTYTPRISGGVIMDPHTGEIIAMAGRPAYDPNTYSTVSNPAVYRNAIVESTFEMGSIMKPLTMAKGIDKGVVTPSTTYNDTGCIEKSGKRVCNSDEKAHGVVSMQIVLNQSLNTGASFVADKIGHTEFGTFMHDLELGKKTGIDLPSEASGQLKSIDNGYDVDYASASFGQGIAVSPIAMIRALSILANGGVLPNPHVVTAIKLQNGITRSVDPGQGPRVLSASSTEAVTNMLVESYDTALIGGILKQEHYSLAAKTGTAQIAIPGGGGYYPDRILHSFFGYFPAHDPKFIILLFAVEPHGQAFASATLSHPFSNLAKYLINYYSIPPDR